MVDLSRFESNLDQTYSEAILSIQENNDHILLETLPSAIVKLAGHLKSKKGFLFNTLIDITAIDFPAREQRFDIVYHFLSMTENQRCRVTTSIADGEEISSITSVFECANWFEREIFDLFGIKFTSHPDLRRILTDYGFEGHPLRKDFPTTGFLEVRYDEVEKRVVYEPTALTQGYRDFDFLSPWDNPHVYTDTEQKNKNK
ncbi:MAG: NADH-quinone oxidoreductase subunit C [Cyanobium sp. NAT70]|nr:NADH-quinone oxidoreductase subunit C [Cyanobium sp. NAT70]